MNTVSRGSLRRLLAGMVTLAMVLAFGACTSPTDDKRLRVYATTGHLADAVRTIAPNAHVSTMVGPGGDPHSYQPSTRDIQTIHGADVVFWIGLNLEAQMDDQLRSLGRRQLAVGEHMPADLLLDLPHTDSRGQALHDPHIWNSPQAWSLVIAAIADKLSTIDPSHAAEYAANAADYQRRLDAAHQEASALLATVRAPRILISGHDAFGYFGKTYDLDVHATDFVSTEARLSARQLSALAALIAENKVPVIFQDHQSNPQAITSLKEAVHALGWQVEVSDKQLHADSLGAGPDVDTHLEVFVHNARAIAEALGGP